MKRRSLTPPQKWILLGIPVLFLLGSFMHSLYDLNGKYPLIVNSRRANWSELSTFFKYPPEIRKIIYTTNMIESYHRQLRKVTKGKSIFPNDESLQKMLYLATMGVLRRWTGRAQNYLQTQGILKFMRNFISPI